MEGGEPEEIVDRLARGGAKHLYLDGGVTVQRFLKAGLVDTTTVTWIPVLLGDGIPLFGQLGHFIELELLESQSAGNGFVQTRYRVRSRASAGYGA